MKRINGNDLFVTYLMDAITGYVAYMKYTYGSQKGDVAQGDVFNTPFKLDSSKVDGTYTSSRVRMTRTGTGASETVSLDWSPVEPGSVVIRFGTTVYADIDRDGVLYEITNATETEIDIGKSQTRTVVSGTKGSAVGTVTYGTTADGRIPTSATAGKGYLPYNQGAQWDTTSNPIKGSVTITSGITSSTPYILTYVYDNAYIPQNDVPMLNGEMDGIHLKAEPHRIQIYYSNLAAFQAKSDYGFDLGENLAKQAVAQLQYDMDTLVVDGLSDAAGTENTSLVWSKTLPIGVKAVAA